MLDDVYFYLTSQDLLEVLSELTTSETLQFVPVERYSDPKEVVVYDLAELTTLGVARCGSELSEDKFLIMAKGATVATLRNEHTDKTASYDVVPGYNPDSVILSAGGEFGDNCIIRGRFRPSSDSRFAVNLYRKLQRLMTEKCLLANKHYLGQTALRRLQEGAVLTHAANSDPSYHFRLPE